MVVSIAALKSPPGVGGRLLVLEDLIQDNLLVD